MKIDGKPCPYCGKETFSRVHLDEDGCAFVECYTDEGGCGRPYVIYIPNPVTEVRKLTEWERNNIEVYYDSTEDLTMEE